MSVKVTNVWIYSFWPIDIRPIIAEFRTKCKSQGLRVDNSVQLDHYDEIAPGSQNTVQRLNVVHSSTSKAKWQLLDDLNQYAIVLWWTGVDPTPESQTADSSRAPVHDFRTMRYIMYTAENAAASFIPVILHCDRIDTFVRQARKQGINMVGILKERGMVENVEGKAPAMLAQMIYQHIERNL
ncbi:MAG: hypothetical protein M1822_000135 [Bathelium mastoideum]|nr:MAG: hypothetical protein M1822_000135 [Bathelium mastoideum]